MESRQTVFINPRSKDVIINVNNRKVKDVFRKGYSTKGDNPANNVEGILKLLQPHPLSLAIYLSSFINVLIDGRIVKANYMVLDIYGEKGKGKSLLQYIAMNPIGDSTEGSALMQTWVGTSDAGGLGNIKIHKSHPVFLADSQMNDINQIQKITYQVFESVMGGKANVDGSARDDGHLSSILVSSSEESIFTRSTKDGVTRRIIPFSIDDILYSIINNQRELENWQKDIGEKLSQSFGIALDPFVNFAQENKQMITEKFKDYIQYYSITDTPPHFDFERYKSFSKYLACIHVVLDYLKTIYQLDFLSKDEIIHICNEIKNNFQKLCISKLKFVEALESILNFAESNKSKHFTKNNHNHTQYGFYNKHKVNGADEECLIIHTKDLTHLLETMGYTSTNTLSSWRKAGIIHVADNKASIRISERIGGVSRPYCTIIILSKGNELIDQMNSTI